jgi:fibronectin type 3 domain-containing protein
LAATASGKRKISLTWSQSAGPGVIQNIVYRSDSANGVYGLVAALAPTTAYQDPGLTSGATYFYRVTALSNAGESLPSNTASATAR